MKIRLLNDTIRLRIQQGELDALGRQGRVEAHTRFGADQVLTCVLERDATAAPLKAELNGHTIRVGVAPEVVEELLQTGLVGVDAGQAAGAGHVLHILVEKDFKCLTPRAGEEDAFPNPNEAC